MALSQEDDGTDESSTDSLPVEDTTIPDDTASQDEATPTYYDAEGNPLELTRQEEDISPALVQAVIHQESRGNPNAVSPVGAKGLMQLMDRTGEAQFQKQNLTSKYGTYDPFNPDQNVELGTAELKDLNKKYQGDTKLVLAANNYGQGNLDKLINKYGKSYDDIEPHLPTETKDYVKNITGNLGDIKSSSRESSQNPDTSEQDSLAAKLPKVDTKNATPDAQGLADSLLQVTSAPEFDKLSLAAKAKAIKDIAYAKYWGPDQDKIVQHLMTNYIDAAPSDQKPQLDYLIGKAPKVDSKDDPSKILDVWKTDKTQELIHQGINPAFFGDQLDAYFKTQSDREKSAYTARNRGFSGWLANQGANLARDVVKGAASAITKPIGGIVRLLGAEEAGNKIADLPAYLGKPADDYAYKTDEGGYLVLNPDKTPVTRWQSDAAQMIGQVGAFIAGGAELNALKYSEAAVRGTLFGANTLTLANDSFRKVYEETGGDVGKSYAAAFISLPAAWLGSFGEYAVIAKWANPAITELSSFNKAKYLATIFTYAGRNAAIGGAATLGMDVTSQLGEMAQTGHPFDSGRAYTALGSGAIISGILGGYQGLTPRFDVGKAASDTTGKPTPPGEEPPAMHYGSVDNQRKMIQHLENFQKSTANELTLTLDEARSIPPNLVPLYALDFEVAGDKVVLRKKSTYTPQVATDLISAEKGILGLTKSLESDSSPNQVQNLTNRKAELKASIDAGVSDIPDTEKRTDAINDVRSRNGYIRVSDKARSAYLSEQDPLQKKVLKVESDTQQKILDSFDRHFPEAAQLSERIGNSLNELDKIEGQIKNATRETYANDIKAKEANLLDHLKVRNEALDEIADKEAKAKGEEPAPRPEFAIEKGVKFKDHAILNKNDRWYVFDKNRDLIGKGHEYYADALDTVNKRIENALPKIVPGIRSEISLLPISDKGNQIPELQSVPSSTVEALKPSSLSLTRRRLSSANKRPSSKYTPLIDFQETGTKPVSAKDIAKPATKLITALNKSLKVFEGTATPKHVLGFLNYVKNYIAVSRFNDPMTLLHEMKHAVDRAIIGKWTTNGVGDYSKLPRDVIAGAKDTAETYYPGGARLSENTKIQEGLAMFFQHYASGQPVHTDILNWYKGEFAKENPKVFKALEGIKDIAHAYFNQTPIAFERSLNEPRPNRTTAEIARYNTLANLNDQWTSKWQVLRDIERDTGDSNLRDLFEANYRKGSAIVSHLINEGPINLKGDRSEGMSLVQALLPAKGKMDILDAYLNAKRDYAYQQAGLEAGSNVQDVAKIIREVETNHPEVAQAANNYYKLQEFVHSVAASASRESAAFIQKLQKANLETTGTKHGYYLPRPREGKFGYNPLAKRTGSTRSRVDPTSYIEQSFKSIIDNALHSQFKQSLVDTVEPGIPANMGSYIREVTGMEYKGLMDQYDKESVAALGPDATKEDKVWQAYNAAPLKGVTGKGFIVMPYMDGNHVRMFELDPRLSRLMSEGVPDFVNSLWFKYLIRPGAITLRTGATTLRPAFQLMNFVRDNLTANRWILSEGGGHREVLNMYKDVMSSILNIPLHHTGLKSDPWVALVDRLGLGGFTRAGSLLDIRKELSPHFGQNIIDLADVGLGKLENILGTPETAHRLALMKFEARRLGITDPTQSLTPSQAMELTLAYKRGTTNFQEQGYSAQYVNMGVPFFTARIAELKRLPDDFKKSPGRMSAYLGTMMAAGLFHALSHKDDKWFNEMQPDGKMQNIWTAMDIGGVQKIMRIPLDNWSAIGWGLGQSFGTKMNEDPLTPESYYDLARAYFSQHTPINSFTELLTPVGKEALAQYSNYDSYFRKAIVPPSLEYVNPAAQATEFTSEFSKEVGKLLGVSPIRIDHAIRNLSPATADVLNFGDKSLGFKKADEYQNINFVASAFARAGTTHSIMDRTQNQFQDTLMQFRENKPAETPEQGNIRKSLERINKDVSKLNMLTYGIDDQTLKDEARDKKYALLRSGLKLINGIKDTPVRLTPKEYGEVEKLRKEKLAQQKHQIVERVKEADTDTALKGSTE